MDSLFEVNPVKVMLASAKNRLFCHGWLVAVCSNFVEVFASGNYEDTHRNNLLDKRNTPELHDLPKYKIQ
jgi:hypothetical protein